jgi:hypothetical protein
MRPASFGPRVLSFMLRSISKETAWLPMLSIGMRWTILILLSFGFACSKTEVPPPAETAPATESEAPGAKEAPLSAEQLSTAEPPSIQLVEPGKEPRRTLRRSVPPGFEQKLSFTTKIAVKALFQGVLGGSVDYPIATYEMSVKAEGTVPGESTTVLFTVNKVSFADLSTTPERQRDEWKKAATLVQGATGSYTFGARGWIENVKVELRSRTSRKARQMADDLEWSLQQLSMPLPEEPVGEGAKWTVKNGLKQGGVQVDQLATVELVTIEGPRVDVKMGIEQAATPQDYTQPGGFGEALELKSLTATGSGEATWNLTELVPRSLNIETSEDKVAHHIQPSAGVLATISTTRVVTVGGR